MSVLPFYFLFKFSKQLFFFSYGVYNFLNKSNVLHNYQPSFLPERSTAHASLHITDLLTKVFDCNHYLSGTFPGLSRSFHILLHEIFVGKVDLCSIRGPSLTWHFSGRPQSVTGKNGLSPPRLIPYGVPHGSILGSLLLVIYINDLHKTRKLLLVILYADGMDLFLFPPRFGFAFSTLYKISSAKYTPGFV